MPGTDSGGSEKPAVETPVGSHAAGRPVPSFDDLTRVLQGSKAIFPMVMTGIFLLGLVVFLRYAMAFVLPVVLAVLFYFLLNPAVLAFVRLRIPRAISALLVLAVFIGAIGTGLSALQEPAKEWLAKTPESLQRVELITRKFIRSIERVAGIEGSRETSPDPAHGTPPPNPLKRFKLTETLLNFPTLLSTASFLTGFLETIVLLYFLLAAGERFLRTLVRVLPRQDEKVEAVAIVEDVQHKLSAFLFTITIINIVIGLLVAMAMRLLGMPNPILWGVIAGLLNFIPYFGPLTVFVVLSLAGLLSFETTGQALLPALVYLGLHAVESNLLTPAILGRRLTLNPLIIFLALMFWTWLWGMPGALLAVPLLMAFKIVCDHVRPLGPIGELLGG